MSYVSRTGAADQEREYRALVDRVRGLIASSVPPGARVLVVTRGDEALLRVEGRDVEHFPQSPTGMYAGHHPGDGAEAVGEVERLAGAGAEFLAIPATALWWLEHYPELRVRLEERGELVGSEAGTGAVYALARRGQAPRLTRDELEAARTGPQAAALVAALLPDDAPLLLVGASAAGVDVGERRCWRLPPPGADHSADEIADQAILALREGARYVVLVEDDDPTRRLDGRLRRRLVQNLKPVFRQRLAEGFEVTEPVGVA